jgi:hypothetical protein
MDRSSGTGEISLGRTIDTVFSLFSTKDSLVFIFFSLLPCLSAAPIHSHIFRLQDYDSSSFYIINETEKCQFKPVKLT